MDVLEMKESDSKTRKQNSEFTPILIHSGHKVKITYDLKYIKIALLDNDGILFAYPEDMACNKQMSVYKSFSGNTNFVIDESLCIRNSHDEKISISINGVLYSGNLFLIDIHSQTTCIDGVKIVK
jgi:hypothetical protein